MARHSLGGLRSLETIDAGDRVLARLSPVQLWIVRETLERTYLNLPPSSNVRQAAKRLTMRGILHMKGDVVRYKPMASSPSPGTFLPNEETDKFMSAATLKRGRPCE